MNYVEALKLCNAGLTAWKDRPHNKQWWKRIEGTPIPNDLLSCIAETFAGQAAPPVGMPVAWIRLREDKVIFRWEKKYIEATPPYEWHPLYTTQPPAQSTGEREGGARKADGVGTVPKCLALPLELDWLKTEGGSGEYESPCIRDANGKVILDALNSDAACLQEEYDGDEDNTWRRVWDEDGRQYVAYIVQAVNQHEELRKALEQAEHDRDHAYVTCGNEFEQLLAERDTLLAENAKLRPSPAGVESGADAKDAARRKNDLLIYVPEMQLGSTTGEVPAAMSNTRLVQLEREWRNKANELMATGLVNMMIKADAIRDCASDLRSAGLLSAEHPAQAAAEVTDAMVLAALNAHWHEPKGLLDEYTERGQTDMRAAIAAALKGSP